MPAASRTPVSAFGTEVAALLRAQAARKRLSHDAISERTGRAISRAQVQRYLTGERSPSVEDLVLLSDALGLDGPDVMTKAARALMHRDTRAPHASHG